MGKISRETISTLRTIAGRRRRALRAIDAGDCDAAYTQLDQIAHDSGVVTGRMMGLNRSTASAADKREIRAIITGTGHGMGKLADRFRAHCLVRGRR